MKFLAIVAMFAFVAVQLSCSAPTPDEEKKEAEAPSVVDVEASSQTVLVEKSDHPEAVASLPEPAATDSHAEEKKS